MQNPLHPFVWAANFWRHLIFSCSLLPLSRSPLVSLRPSHKPSHQPHSNTSNTVINQDACRNQEEGRLFLRALSLRGHRERRGQRQKERNKWIYLQCVCGSVICLLSSVITAFVFPLIYWEKIKRRLMMSSYSICILFHLLCISWFYHYFIHKPIFDMNTLNYEPNQYHSYILWKG